MIAGLGRVRDYADPLPGLVVVWIDELDRCPPEYALGTLRAVRSICDHPGIACARLPSPPAPPQHQQRGAGTPAHLFDPARRKHEAWSDTIAAAVTLVILRVDPDTYQDATARYWTSRNEAPIRRQQGVDGAQLVVLSSPSRLLASAIGPTPHAPRDRQVPRSRGARSRNRSDRTSRRATSPRAPTGRPPRPCRPLGARRTPSTRARPRSSCPAPPHRPATGGADRSEAS